MIENREDVRGLELHFFVLKFEFWNFILFEMEGVYERNPPSCLCFFERISFASVFVIDKQNIKM